MPLDRENSTRRPQTCLKFTRSRKRAIEVAVEGDQNERLSVVELWAQPWDSSQRLITNLPISLVQPTFAQQREKRVRRNT